MLLPLIFGIKIKSKKDYWKFDRSNICNYHDCCLGYILVCYSGNLTLIHYYLFFDENLMLAHLNAGNS